MPSYADQLARAKAHIEGMLPMPIDLGRWVLDQLADSTAADYMRLRRDQHLLAAARFVEGSVSQRAKAILAEGARLDRSWARHRARQPQSGSFEGEVHAARLLMPLPRERQLRSILSGKRWQQQAW